MAKLDRRDRIILYELDRDARQPLSSIAKKAHLSREAVLYRVRGYLKDGIIRNYLAVINMAKLGFTHHKVYVKLHNASAEKEKELVDYLCKSPRVTWAASCEGKYSLAFAVKARDLVELDAFMKELNRNFWQYIMVADISSIIGAHYFHRNYLIGGRRETKRQIFWGISGVAAKLDKEDVGVLDALAESPRATSVEIAKRLGVSPDSVLRRIKRLEGQEILEHNMLWPDVNKLRGFYYKVLITLRNTTAEREEKLLKFCGSHPDIVYIVNCVGPWQFEIDVEVASMEEFRALMQSLLREFPDIVSDYTPLNIYEEHKYRFFEQKLLE
jgi:Lrp/AsnC family leucine-responsive transcriptional regulator